MSKIISSWVDKIIAGSFYLLFFLVPLIVTPFNFELFEYNKMMLTYALTLIIATSWIIKMVCDKEIKIRQTPFDIPFLLFALSQTVSTVFSIDRHLSLFGYYSRFNGGLLSIATYMTLYYTFVSNIKKENIKKYILVALSSAVLVCLYAVAERLGIDKHIWIQDVQNRVFSTLGQPNWLAAYIAILIPVSIGLSLHAIPKLKNIFTLQFILYFCTSLLFYLTLIFTKSRSGFLGFWIANISLWTLLGFSLLKDKRKIVLIVGSCINLLLTGIFISGGEYVWFILLNIIVYLVFLVLLARPYFGKALILINGSFLLISFLFQTPLEQINRFSLPSILTSISTSNSQPRPKDNRPLAETTPLLETGITESGDIRRIVWKGAIDILKDHPYFGTGTETFAFAYYKYRPKEHNMTSEWDFLYNKAHNEYLNYAATTGLFGLGTYLLFLGSVIIWFVLKFVNKNTADVTMLAGFFTGWLSILITNFLGFSVVIVQLYFFLIPAMSVLIANQKEKSLTLSLKTIFPDGKTAKLLRQQWVLLVAILFLFIFFGYRLVTAYIADTYYATGYQEGKAGLSLQSYQSLSQALALNPREVLYYDELSLSAASLSVLASKQNEATLSTQLKNQAISASNFAISTSPKNVSFYKTRTRVFYELAQIDPVYLKQAIASLQIAFSLSPTDPKVAYNLGLMYGKDGQNTKAIEYLEKSTQLKPNYREGYIALALYYIEIKEPEKARQAVQFILEKINPGDSDATGILKQLDK